MYQIDVATAAAALPAPATAGTPGYYTGGNPATATPPTVFGADMANMLMLEILNTVTAAGIAPSKTTYTQLRDAIRLLALAALRAASYAVDVGSVNAIVATPSLLPPALSAGLQCSVKIAHTNTAGVTLNFAGFGIFAVTSNGTVIVPGSLVASSIYAFEYDGANWELISPEAAAALPVASTGGAGVVALATAAETKAGTESSKATTAADVASASQSGGYLYAVDTGAVNAMAAALTPVPAALVAGIVVTIKAAITTTAAATLNLNGLGVVAITSAGQPTIGGQIAAGQLYRFAYDGTSWEMMSPAAGAVQLGDTGYEHRAGGLVEQWGYSSTSFSGEGTGPISFPIAFPNACRNISITPRNPSSSNTRDTTVQIVSRSTTGFVVYYQNNGGGSANCDGFDWRALGD